MRNRIIHVRFLTATYICPRSCLLFTPWSCLKLPILAANYSFFPEKIEPGTAHHHQQAAAIQAPNTINAKQSQIEDQYQKLLMLGEQRTRKLSEACKGYQLLREANDLADWIRSREAVASQQEIGTDLEQVEILQASLFRNRLTEPTL